MNFRYDVPKYEKAELKYAKVIFFAKANDVWIFAFVLSSSFHSNSLSEAKLKKKK